MGPGQIQQTIVNSKYSGYPRIFSFKRKQGVDRPLDKNRVFTDLEESLNLTLVLENSWILIKVTSVLELSCNFVKLSLKMN